MEAAQTLNQAMSDVVQACSGREIDSEFETIFTTHYERVLAVLLRLLGERAQAGPSPISRRARFQPEQLSAPESARVRD